VTNIKTYDDTVASPWSSSADDGALVHIYLRFDRSYDVYDRSVKDFLTLLSDIGGLQKSLFAFGMIFVSFFAQKLFMANIIRRVYQIRKYEEEKDKDDKDLDIDDNILNYQK
jgi:hypothetical protein